MSIRVQHDTLTGAGVSESSRANEAALGSTSASKRGSGQGLQDGDRIEISSLSGGITASLASANAQQASRVSQLAALYASGRYQVDAAKVSRALVEQSIGAASDPGEPA
jgi:anti-sigma28 factor (negative regulator of flagellin synthesis)